MADSVASATPQTKRQRLAAEIASATGTKIAAARVLKLLSDRCLLADGVAASSERSVRDDARKGIKLASDTDTIYGPVISKLHFGPLCVEIANPFAYLHVLCQQSASLYRAIFPSGHVNRGIVVYIDEVRPGNPLRPEKNRLTQCVYWTFCDFDDHVLCRADGWFLATVLLSTTMDQVPGKASGFMRALLNVFFPAEGTSFATGVVLSNGNDCNVLTCHFAGFLGDEKALKEVWCLKGASGSRPCITCTNLIQFVDESARNGTNLQGMDCWDMRKLRRTSDAEVFDMADRLKALHDGGCTKIAMARLEQMLGMTYDPHSILYDLHLRTFLRPITHYLRDWMHTIASHGVASTQIAAVLGKLKTNGVKLDAVQKYMSCFVLPLARGRVSDTWFAQNRVTADHMKCFAGEILTMVQLFNEFLQDAVVPSNLMLDDCRCFALLADIVQVLQSGPSAAAASHVHLQAAIVEHHSLYARLYPTLIKPKWHHMLHLAEHGRDTGRIMACFVTERKNRQVKTAGTWTFRHYDGTVLRNLIFQQCEAVCRDNVHAAAFLHVPRQISAGGVDVQRATVATVPCGEVHADDLLACRTADGSSFVAKAVCFVTVHGDESIYAQVVPLRPTECRRTWGTQGGAELLVLAADIVAPVAYAKRSGECVRIVMPRRW